MFCDSNGSHGDARAGADDEDRLVGAHLGPRGEHSPGGQKGEGESGGLLPGQAGGLAKEIASVDVDQLARRAVGVFAQDAKAGTPDVLPRAAPVALPAAESGEDHDLVAGSPGGIPAGCHDPGAIRGDHARRGDALRAMGKPEVEVVERGGLDRHGD
jgi:hypothetical protein